MAHDAKAPLEGKRDSASTVGTTRIDPRGDAREPVAASQSAPTGSSGVAGAGEAAPPARSLPRRPRARIHLVDEGGTEIALDGHMGRRRGLGAAGFGLVAFAVSGGLLALWAAGSGPELTQTSEVPATEPVWQAPDVIALMTGSVVGEPVLGEETPASGAAKASAPARQRATAPTPAPERAPVAGADGDDKPYASPASAVPTGEAAPAPGLPQVNPY